jgi:glycosyltransferase involved in cell wall biosynthesis
MSGFVINGRFLSQPLTGVQRFAREVVREIDLMAAAGQCAPPTIALPPGCEPLAWRALRTETVGTRRGHAWEQIDLPRFARDRWLISLGNTAPLLAGARQSIVIHDTGVFDVPRTYSLRFRLAYRTLQRLLVRANARFLAVSDFTRSRMVRNLGLSPQHIAVVGEGSDHILRAPADPAALGRLGLAPGGYVLLVGVHSLHKGIGVVTQAYDQLAALGLRLVAVGAQFSELNRGPQTAAGDAWLSVGRVADEELRALYEGALCLLFPSRYEGFGLPIVEAMSCGCPVVAAQSSVLGEVVGGAAFSFPVDDVERLVSAVARLQGDAAAREELSAQGLRRAASFSWNAAATRVLGTVPESDRR